MPSPARSVLREAAIVARYEVASMVLSVRALLFLIVYGITAGSAGAFFLWMDQQSGGQLMALDARAGALDETTRQQILGQIGGQGVLSSAADSILSGNLPVLVVLVLVFSTFVLPGLVLLVGYSGIAEDLQTRFTRYAFQRVRRGSWLAGKVAAHFLVTLSAVLLVHLALLAAGSRIPNLELGTILSALPRVWLGMAIFLLAYVSYSAVFSTLVSPPFAAFAVGTMVLAGLWVSSLGPLHDVWMGSNDTRLWVLEPAGILLFLAYTAGFLTLAWLGLRRRDV